MAHVFGNKTGQGFSLQYTTVKYITRPTKAESRNRKITSIRISNDNVQC